jgi:periplasmic protein TonB
MQFGAQPTARAAIHHPETRQMNTTTPTSMAFAQPTLAKRLLAWTGLCATALLVACAAPTAPKPSELPAQATLAAPAAPAPTAMAPVPDLVSIAGNPQEYRRDGAKHLYERNKSRIFKGQLPPLVYAVAVLQIDIDRMGQVSRLNWARPPTHAPEVVREIERTVYAAAPFPAPVRMGGVTYTDVWLWDKSGNFQLDTLTEGQRRK